MRRDRGLGLGEARAAARQVLGGRDGGGAQAAEGVMRVAEAERGLVDRDGVALPRQRRDLARDAVGLGGEPDLLAFEPGSSAAQPAGGSGSARSGASASRRPRSRAQQGQGGEQAPDLVAARPGRAARRQGRVVRRRRPVALLDEALVGARPACRPRPARP